MNADRKLVRDYLHGSAAAFDRLFDRRDRSLQRFAYHLTGHRADAEDLCQSAWLQALRSLSTYLGHSSFRAWLHGIALNIHKDQRRTTRPRTVDLDPEQPSDAVESDPQRAAERAETSRALRAALRRLSPEAHEVILLVKIQGLTYDEAGSVLGCPTGTIKSRLHYAMADLRATLTATSSPMEVHREVQPDPRESHGPHGRSTWRPDSTGGPRPSLTLPGLSHGKEILARPVPTARCPADTSACGGS